MCITTALNKTLKWLKQLRSDFISYNDATKQPKYTKTSLEWR